MVRKVVKFTINTVAALICLGVFVLAYFLSDRDPPIFVLAAWIPVDEVYPGDELSVRVIFVKSKDYNLSIEQTLFSDFSTGSYPQRIPYELTNLSVGLNIVNLTMIVPATMPRGRASYQAVFKFADSLNPVQSYSPLEKIIGPLFLEIKEPTPDEIFGLLHSPDYAYNPRLQSRLVQWSHRPDLKRAVLLGAKKHRPGLQGDPARIAGEWSDYRDERRIPRRPYRGTGEVFQLTNVCSCQRASSNE